jgi:hypothetical protein
MSASVVIIKQGSFANAMSSETSVALYTLPVSFHRTEVAAKAIAKYDYFWIYIQETCLVLIKKFQLPWRNI